MTGSPDPIAEGLDVAGWFDVPDLDAWKAEVERVLKGRAPDTLASRLPEGFAVPVLHGPAAPAELGPVDAAPWRRGDGGLERRAHGWAVGVAIDTGEVAADLDLAVAAVEGGATALTWCLPEGRDPRVELRARLDAAGLPHPEVFADPAAFLVDTLPCAEAGGTAVHELALLLLEGAARLRSTGMLPPRPAVRLAVQRDTFVETAKLRAARWLWGKLADAARLPAEAGRLRLVAQASRSAWTAVDAWVNVLRGGHAAFVGAVGGADVVVLPCWDRALGVPEPAAARLAATGQAVLREEAWLHAVADPAGGSWYVEALTDRLAREAWALFQAVEGEGGLEAARRTTWAARIAEARAARERAVARRAQGIVGVSLFPHTDEVRPVRASASLPVARDAAGWEALRARGEARSPRPRVLLLTLGERWRAREGFCRPLLEAAGFEVLTVAELPAPDARTGVVLCADDADHTALVPGALAASAGACFRALAGRPGEHETAWRAAGLTHTIAAGDDLLATVTRLLDAVEAA